MFHSEDGEVRQLEIGLHAHTLRCPLSERFVKFIDNLLEAVRRHLLAMGAKEMQLNAPCTQRHLLSRITPASRTSTA